MYVLPVTLSGIATPRYAAAPAMLLTAALVALLQPGVEARRPIPLWALTLVLAITCAVNLRVDNDRAHGPAWHESLAQARQACATGTAAVDVPVAPLVTPVWLAHVPCDYIGHGGR
jgi:hypothetical protein